MNKQKLYKILENGKACHGGEMAWPLPQNGKPGKWVKHEGELELCESGLHLTPNPFNWYIWNCDCYEAEYQGEIVWDENKDKCAVRQARLLRKVKHPKWWVGAHGFVEKEISAIPWFQNDGKPLKKWLVFETMDAAGAATWDVAGVAAGDAARAAARSAARAAAGSAARAAAWDAARAAAWDAARAAAWDVAGVAAGSAARAAAIYMHCVYVCDGLPLARKHIQHAKDRWRVWQKGYGLLCDVGGVLYVYKRP